MKEDAIALAYYLLEYEGLVAHCNQMITNYYQLDISPILAKNAKIIPKTATIIVNNEKLHFALHGIGCLCTSNEWVVDFDYSFATFIYKGFEAHKVWEFINSDARRTLKDKRTFFNALPDLEGNGIILRQPINQTDTHEYILNLERIQNLGLSGKAL